MNESDKNKRTFCAIHQNVALHSKAPIINEKSIYNICGKCLRELNQITISLYSLYCSRVRETMGVPGLRETIQKLFSLKSYNR